MGRRRTVSQHWQSRDWGGGETGFVSAAFGALALMPLVGWQDSYRRIILALRIAKLMAYDLGVDELPMDEVTYHLDDVVCLSLGEDDLRAAVLESCRYLSNPSPLMYLSDAHGRGHVLCKQDAFERLWE
eukprot:13005806-Alexandrium_andersonii.AAC.1